MQRRGSVEDQRAEQIGNTDCSRENNNFIRESVVEATRMSLSNTTLIKTIGTFKTHLEDVLVIWTIGAVDWKPWSCD